LQKVQMGQHPAWDRSGRTVRVCLRCVLLVLQIPHLVVASTTGLYSDLLVISAEYFVAIAAVAVAVVAVMGVRRRKRWGMLGFLRLRSLFGRRTLGLY